MAVRWAWRAVGVAADLMAGAGDGAHFVRSNEPGDQVLKTVTNHTMMGSLFGSHLPLLYLACERRIIIFEERKCIML